MTGLDLCACRQELSALREDFVRRQAEEEAYHAKQVSVFPFCLFEAKVLQWIQTFSVVAHAGAAAEGRGAAAEAPRTGRGKTDPAEGKVTEHKQHITFAGL